MDSWQPFYSQGSAASHHDSGWRSFISCCENKGINPQLCTDDEMGQWIANNVTSGSAKNYKAAVTHTVMYAHGEQRRSTTATDMEVKFSKKRHQPKATPTFDSRRVHEWVDQLCSKDRDARSSKDIRTAVHMTMATVTGMRMSDVRRMADAAFTTTPSQSKSSKAATISVSFLRCKEVLLSENNRTWSNPIEINQPTWFDRACRPFHMGMWLQILRDRINLHLHGTESGPAAFDLDGRKAHHGNMMLPVNSSGKFYEPDLSTLPPGQTTPLSTDSLSDGIKSVFKATGFDAEFPAVTPRHLRHWFATFVCQLAVPDGLMTREQASAMLRHSGKDQMQAYDADIINAAVKRRWLKASNKDRKTLSQLMHA